MTRKFLIGYDFALIVARMMARFSLLFRAKLFTGKLGSHEISNILHPDHAHHLQEQALQLLVFSAIDKYLGAKPKGATERPDVFCHYNCE